MDSSSQEKTKKQWSFAWLILIPLCVYFYFGLSHLAQFETADEHYWIYDPVEGRIHDYSNPFGWVPKDGK